MKLECNQNLNSENELVHHVIWFMVNFQQNFTFSLSFAKNCYFLGVLQLTLFWAFFDENLVCIFRQT